MVCTFEVVLAETPQITLQGKKLQLTHPSKEADVTPKTP